MRRAEMRQLNEAVIVSAVRTPVGKFGGVFRETSAVQLGSLCVKSAIERAGISPSDVQEVILGNVLSSGLGQSPARQCAIGAGVPYGVGALNINKVCGSGLKALMLAANSVRLGEHEVVVAGGIENMSMAPYISQHTRWGNKYGDVPFLDSMIHDGLWDAYNNFHMMITGEIVAERFKITREEADAFAYRSHKRASEATSEGLFKDEIVPVTANVGKEKIVVTRDEGPRADTTLAKLSRLESKFKKDGLCTAGNSSQLSDGASALVVMSEKQAERLGAKPMARIIDYNTGGTRPEWVMEAPIESTRDLLKRNSLHVGDIDLFEHNEAYATASIAVQKTLGISDSSFNINGGAVALGHPLGATGARITTTLLYSLRKSGRKRGVSTLCLGGGNAVSMLLEMV